MFGVTLRRAEVALFLELAIAYGCRPSRTAPDAVRELSHSDGHERRKAAGDIVDAARDDGSLPPQVADELLERLSLETDPVTRHKIMMALVEIGDSRIHQALYEYMQTTNYAEQHARAPLYRTYLVKTGRHPADGCFPRDWPYGTPGFPAPANAGVVWIEDAPAPPKFMLKAEIGATARFLFGSPVLGFDIDNAFGARTKSGIWGARIGMFHGETAEGLYVAQYRIGPFWEAPTEFVRPIVMPRLTLLDIARHTHSGPPMISLGLGLHAGLAFDLWRHELDHGVFVSVTGGFDGAPEDYFLPGATIAFGGRY
jgi:hypothetical protein